jgi:hypothetical protein
MLTEKCSGSTEKRDVGTEKSPGRAEKWNIGTEKCSGCTEKGMSILKNGREALRNGRKAGFHAFCRSICSKNRYNKSIETITGWL